MKNNLILLILGVIIISFVCAANTITENVPEKLFDIRFSIEDASITYSDDLTTIAIYENFGRVPTTVDLLYTIYSEDGLELYREEGSVEVEVEEIQSKHFRGLNLPPGKYYFIFQTVYNVDVHDEFRGDFEVLGYDKQFLFRVLGGIALVALTLIVVYFLNRRCNEN